MHDVITSGDDVTYYATHDKATRELGFDPRSLEQGVRDTWGGDSATAKAGKHA